MKPHKKKSKILLLITFLLGAGLFFTYGVNFCLSLLTQYYFDANFHLQVQYDSLQTNGWYKIQIENMKVTPSSGYYSATPFEINIPQLEVRYKLWDFLFNGKKIFEQISVTDLSVKAMSSYQFHLDSLVQITSDEKNEKVTVLVQGKFRGKFEVAKADNLSWQIDALSVEQVGSYDVWQLQGQIQDEQGGVLSLYAEQMGKIFQLDLKAKQINLEKYLQENDDLWSQQQIDVSLFMKGDRDNLERFYVDTQYYKGKNLLSNGYIKLYRSKEVNAVVHDLKFNYENNILLMDYVYSPDSLNRASLSLAVDADNRLSGSLDGKINSLYFFITNFYKNFEWKDLQGGVSAIGNISGSLHQPVVEMKIMDQWLSYQNKPIEARSEISIHGYNIKVPVLQLKMGDKVFNSAIEASIAQHAIHAQVMKIEVGKSDDEFRNVAPILFEISKKGVSIKEFTLKNKNAEIRAISQILANGEAISKVFVQSLEIKNLIEFLNVKLPYRIEGKATAEIKFFGSLTKPKVQLVGRIEHGMINSSIAGNCKIDLQLDGDGLSINAFELSNEQEKSRFAMNGFIPLNMDLTKLSFAEDIHRERAFYFSFQDTSIDMLSHVMPKTESLNGRITGELSVFKLEDKRYSLGHIRVVGNKMAFKGNLAPITSLDCEVSFSKEKIEITKLTGKLGEGTFNISGALDLIDFKVSAINFKIKGKSLRLINDDDLEVILSPDLTYTGSVEAPLLKGMIYADYGNYTDNLNKLADKINTFKNPSNEFGFWPNTELDLDVRCDHKVFSSIKQTAFALQGSANLKFKGFIANVYMSGLVRVEKGIIPVFSKEFIVEGGSVVFEENTPPFVNLTANYRGNRIDVKMQVNQSLDEPIEPIYSSLPSLTDEEIQRYLTLNLLPGEEGENIDLRAFIKTITDYSDVLSNDTLRWLKRFSFETRTRNRSGQEELGLTIEYKFDEPEWFSVKAIQDDNGVFNFFLVASKDYLGYFIDPSLFTEEDFVKLDSNQIVDFITEISKFSNLNLPQQKNNEFDIQYLVRSLNLIINDENMVDKIQTKEMEMSVFNRWKERQKEVSTINNAKDRLKACRKLNRAFLQAIFKKHFESKLNPEEEEKDIFRSKIRNKVLNGQQKDSLRKLVKDEMKSYVRLNDISFLNNAANKMKRICASWGYRDAEVKWEKIENSYLNSEKTVQAIKFRIDTGARYRFKEIQFTPSISKEEYQKIVNEIKFIPYKSSAPVFYSDNYVNYLKNQIAQYYLLQGFLDVSVTPSNAQILHERNKDVSVTFTVEKGKLYRIEEFELLGNQQFTKETILQVVLEQMHKQGITSAQSLEGEVLHDTLISKIRKFISEFYKQRGYYRVEVTNRVKSAYEFRNLMSFELEFSGNFKAFYLENFFGKKSLAELFPFVQKFKTNIEYYQFFNNLISNSTSRWLFLQNFIDVDSWKNQKIKELYLLVKRDRDEMQEQFLVRMVFAELYGFRNIDTMITNNKDIASDDILLSLVCQIVEGGKYQFGKITYKARYGDKFKTRRSVIEKNIMIKEGEIYDVDKIRQTVRRLSHLGVFQEVEYNETIVDKNVNIEFILRESKTINMQVEAGYGEFEGLQGGLRINDHNILGTTRTLGFRGSVSEKSLLLEPVFDTAFWWGFRNEWVGFYERGEKEDFTLERIGFETNLHRSYKKYYGVSFGYKFENTTATNLVSELNQLDVGYVNFSGLQGGVTYITIDDFLMPHKGTFFKWRSEYNSKIFGSTFDFFKSEIQATQHFPISERITFSIGARLGYMKSLSAGFDIPIQSRFFSGGGNTIRGYSHNSIGPNIDGKSIGGEVRGIFNSEIRFPLTVHTTKQFGVVFFDTGFLEDSIEEAQDPKFYSSLGVGYRYLSPIGPIRLDLGVELEERKREEGGVLLESHKINIDGLFIDGYKARLHLSFGFAF